MLKYIVIPLLVIFTSLVVGHLTFGHKPLSIYLERPFTALSAFLTLSGFAVFILFAVDREHLNHYTPKPRGEMRNEKVQ